MQFIGQFYGIKTISFLLVADGLFSVMKMIQSQKGSMAEMTFIIQSPTVGLQLEPKIGEAFYLLFLGVINLVTCYIALKVMSYPGH